MANSLINQYCKLSELMPEKFNRCSGYWLVLLALCNRANKKTHVAFPSLRKLSKEVHLSEKMTRRHLRKLESDGLIKTVKNAHGGKPGDTRHYKITLPGMEVRRQDTTPPSDEPVISPTEERIPPHRSPSTTPMNVSQTINQPYITYKVINDKYGYGWECDPNKTYEVGRFIGLTAQPGEGNAPFVARIRAKLNRMQTLN